MNKQSNTYTVLYIIAIVVIVGTALALTAMSLKPMQQANARADKMKQILAALHVTAGDKVAEEYDKYVTEILLVSPDGSVINHAGATDAGAFNINVANESKLPDAKRQLPVFVSKVDGEAKYIIPVAGNGLWGPIWGYVALNADGSTIYGAYFSHQGETPGLGAEIEKPDFQNRFDGKEMFKGMEFLPVTVIKAGSAAPADGRDFVDGVSGGTITSKGVAAMLDNCLKPYAAFLENVRTGNLHL